MNIDGYNAFIKIQIAYFQIGNGGNAVSSSKKIVDDNPISVFYEIFGPRLYK